HGHVPIFRPRLLNLLTDFWITVFYGLPCFHWQAVHVKIHHTYNNDPRHDVTSTGFGAGLRGLPALLKYLAVTTILSLKADMTYLCEVSVKNRRRFYYCWLQIIGLVGLFGALLVVDAKKALVGVLLPQQVAVVSLSLLNYCQHLGTCHKSHASMARNF